MKTARYLFAAVIAMLALALPAQAFAQAGDPNVDPTAAQYEAPAPITGGNQGGGDQGGEEAVVLTSTDTAGPSSSGTLPFTGFDVGVLAAIAALLGLTGFALRRYSAVR